MKHDALMIIDMQNGLIEDHPYNEQIVINNIKTLIDACRSQHLPIIYIRHDGGENDVLEYASKGWQIYPTIAPQAQDKIFEKQYNSAFRKTGLRAYLDSLDIKNIIMCGMQTEFCFDTTCKVAFEYEYQITIGQDTTTTFDTPFATAQALNEYYQFKIWDQRYARVIPLSLLLEEIKP